MHQIPAFKRFSYCLAAVFSESLEARCQVENEDVVGAAPTGDAPTTSEWSTILLPTWVHLILEVLRYIVVTLNKLLNSPIAGDFTCYKTLVMLLSMVTAWSYPYSSDNPYVPSNESESEKMG